MLKLVSSLLFATLVLIGCSIGQGASKTDLTPTEFSNQLKETENPMIMDVRTPGEFLEGHIQNAVNIDWNGANFDAQISKIDKSTPLFMYCLSGGRSSSAASHLREVGFKNVLELDGGMMAWRSAGLPETTDTKVVKSTGMSVADFEKLLQSDKVVLVDFYAEWCGPCKKMKPSIEAIEKEMAAKVTVIRIDVDKHVDLVKSFGIQEIPILRVYKQGKVTWEQKGFVEKELIVKNL